MQRAITRLLLSVALLLGLGLVLWLAALDTPRVADGQTDRSWVAGYLDDQHYFGQFVNLPPDGLAGIRLWLPRPVVPGTGELIVHLRSAGGGPDRATAHVAVAALAQHGPTDFRFTALQADPLRDRPITPLLLVLESRGVDRANAVSIIAGHNRYSNGLLVRDGRELPRADLAFEPLYASCWLDRLLPITRIAQHRPCIFGWPPLYALLAYVLLLVLGWLLGRFVQLVVNRYPALPTLDARRQDNIG
jgi:hypothetical protein